MQLPQVDPASGRTYSLSHASHVVSVPCSPHAETNLWICDGEQRFWRAVAAT
jgi:hypothetical protein